MAARSSASDAAASPSDPLGDLAAPASRNPFSLEVLKINSFRNLLAVELIGGMAFEARIWALAWIIWSLTESAAWIGVVFGFWALPTLLIAQFGGAYTDLVERRIARMWIYGIQTLTVLLIAVLVSLETINVWHIFALALPLSFFTMLRFSTAAAMTIDSVGSRLVFKANGWTGIAGQASKFWGPAIGGALLAWSGPDAVLYFVAASTTVSMVYMWFVKTENQAVVPRVSPGVVRQEFAAGVKYIWGTPALRWLTVMSLSTVSVGLSGPIIPGWAAVVLGEGGEGFAVLTSSAGLGGLIGAVAYMLLPPIRQLARALVFIALFFTVTTILFAFTTTLQTASIIFLLNGMFIPWWGNILRTMFLIAAREDMRGRATTVMALAVLAIAFGWMIGGFLAEQIGMRETLIVSGVGLFVPYLLVYLRSAELRQIGR